MIIAIRGVQRTGKNAIATLLIKQLHEEKLFDNGSGNCTEKIPGLKWKKFDTSLELLDYMTDCMNNGRKRELFLMDEAHRALNPQLFKSRKADDTYALSSIYMDDKLESYIIYTCHNGNMVDRLLGVDLLLRGGTNLYIDIISTKEFVRSTGCVVCRFTFTDTGLTYDKVVSVKEVFKNFDTSEVVR